MQKPRISKDPNATSAGADPSSAAADPAPRASHATLRYTTFRLAIFFVALLLLWLVRVHGLLLVALALLISGLASFTLLAKQRDEMSIQLTAARERRKQQAQQRAAREDAIADELAERSDHADAAASRDEAADLRSR